MTASPSEGGNLHVVVSRLFDLLLVHLVSMSRRDVLTASRWLVVIVWVSGLDGDGGGRDLVPVLAPYVMPLGLCTSSLPHAAASRTHNSRSCRRLAGQLV